jgi:hypothetical protein
MLLFVQNLFQKLSSSKPSEVAFLLSKCTHMAFENVWRILELPFYEQAHIYGSLSSTVF